MASPQRAVSSVQQVLNATQQQQQQAVYATLVACTTAAGQERKAAEDNLKALSQVPWYGLMLAQIMGSAQLNPNHRQLAGLVLRQYINAAWDESDSPIRKTTEEEKKAIRQTLPMLLNEPNSKLRTAVAMVIGQLGRLDYPDDWPDLVAKLISFIGESQRPDLQQGALQSMVMFAEVISDEKLVHVVPTLFPVLIRIASNNNAQEISRQRAVAIFQIALKSFITVTDRKYTKMLSQTFLPILPNWVQVLQSILQDLPRDVNTQFGLRQVALRTFKTMVERDPQRTRKYVGPFCNLLWKYVTGCLKSYEAAFVHSKQIQQAVYDTEGEAVSLDSFLSQIFEFFGTVLELDMAEALDKVLPDLVYALVSYKQITVEEEQTWESDPNEYVAFEDDESAANVSLRISANICFQFLSERHGETRGHEMLAVVIKRLHESEQMKRNKHPGWWKLRESCLSFLGVMAQLLDDGRKMDSVNLSKSVVLPCLEPSTVPLLRARALWCVSHLTPLICEANDLVNVMMRGLVHALQKEQPIYVRLSATRAFGVCCVNLPQETLKPYLTSALKLVAEVLIQATEDSLHMMLEMFFLCLKVDRDITAEVAPSVIPLMVHVWGANPKDPEVIASVTDIFVELAENPANLPGIQAQVYSVLQNILTNHAKFYSGVVEAAMDLTLTLVECCHKASPPVALHPSFLSQAFPTVLSISLATNDTALLMSGTQVCSVFVRHMPQQIAALKVNNQSLLPALCKLVERQLNGSAEEFGCGQVHHLLQQLVFKLSPQLGQNTVMYLLKSAATRLMSAQWAPILEGILVVFARVFHAQGPKFLDLLQSLGSLDTHTPRPPGQPDAPTEKIQGPVLSLLLQKWVSYQSDIHSSYHTKVTVTALMKLLQMKDPRLGSIKVQGYALKPKPGKNRPKTRSQGAPDRTHSSLPLQVGVARVFLAVWHEHRVNALIRAERKAGRHGGVPAGLLEEELSDRDSQDDDDDDDDEQGGSSAFAPADEWEDVVNGVLAGSITGRGQGKHGGPITLSELLDHEYESEEIDMENPEDLTEEEKKDPLNALNLMSHIEQFFRAFAKGDAPTFQAIVNALDQEDRNLLKEIMNTHTPESNDKAQTGAESKTQ